MTVVSNTSPLNYLILIGHADILSKLYEAVEIPRAVFDELQDRRSPGLVRKWMKDPPTWLRVSITVHKLDAELEQIQIGERQAIILAQQIRSDFIILDDLRARRIARGRNLNVVGTVGVLTSAAEQGLIDLGEAVENLRRTSFRISPALLESLAKRE